MKYIFSVLRIVFSKSINFLGVKRYIKVVNSSVSTIRILLGVHWTFFFSKTLNYHELWKKYDCVITVQLFCRFVHLNCISRLSAEKTRWTKYNNIFFKTKSRVESFEKKLNNFPKMKKKHLQLLIEINIVLKTVKKKM